MPSRTIRSTASAPAATRPTGTSTAPWRCPCATLTRCSSRPWPSSAIVGLALVLGFLGFAIVSGARRGPTSSRSGRRSAPRWRSSPPGSSRRRSTGPGSCPACFGLVVLAAALLTGPATLDARAGPRRRHPGGRRRPSARPRRPTGPIRARRGDAAGRLGRDLGRRHPVPDRGQARRQPRRRRAPATSTAAAQDARDAITLAAVGGGPPAPARPGRGAGGRPARPPIETSARRSSAPPTTGSCGSCGRGWTSSPETSTARAARCARPRGSTRGLRSSPSDRAIRPPRPGDYCPGDA